MWNSLSCGALTASLTVNWRCKWKLGTWRGFQRMVLRKAAKTGKLKLQKCQDDPWGAGGKVVQCLGL